MIVTKLKKFNKKCTGCSACYSICPVNAIKMIKNKEGFLFPFVDSNKCIKCGKCVSVCQINDIKKNIYPQRIYSAYSKIDKIRQIGSSGGIIPLLSQKFLFNNGIIYGAIFDKKSKLVLHKSSNDVEVDKLYKSKYVQSILNDTFKNVKNDLKNNKKVLFCGTPCQISGIKKFLKNDFDNLYTIDFFCHGVPSPEIFKKYIDEEEKKHNKKINNIVFRDKIKGWKNNHISIIFEDGNIVSKENSKNTFYYFFIKNYSLRKSCYNCEKYNSHISDLTVADYWKTNNIDDKGVSLILINTDKGKELINSIENQLNLQDIDNFDYKIYKHNYKISKRNKFYKIYLKKGINYTFNQFYKKEKFKNDKILKIKLLLLKLLKRGE